MRSRLIKSEMDDPFDDRLHAINRDGSMFLAPGHISWNVWIIDACRQLAIIQGEGLRTAKPGQPGAFFPPTSSAFARFATIGCQLRFSCDTRRACRYNARNPCG